MYCKYLYGDAVERTPSKKAGWPQPELQLPGIFQLFGHWADEGHGKGPHCSVKHLSDENKLDLSLLQGDGLTPSPKRGEASETAATNTEGERSSRWPTTTATVLSPLTHCPVIKPNGAVGGGLKDLQICGHKAGLS